MSKKPYVTDEEFARDMKEAGVKMRIKRSRVGRPSPTQETLINIAWAGCHIGYIQTNKDGTHAEVCGCRWCVSRRDNQKSRAEIMAK